MSALAILCLRGTRNPHVLVCTFWFLRAVRAQYCCARQIFNAALTGQWEVEKNVEFCDTVQGARSAVCETVRGCTASVRAPRNAAQGTKNAFGGSCA